jgi:hypothetical protein
MGGIGSGGAPGSGRQSKSEHQRFLDGGADKRGRKRPKKPAAPKPVAMPGDVSDAVRPIWLALAPHATTARTLTPATVGAFRDLCEAIVLKRRLLDAIEAGGLTYLKVTIDGAGQEHMEQKANPLLAQHRGMMQRVEAGLKCFRLSPIGKEMSAPEVPSSPFDEFDAWLLQ